MRTSYYYGAAAIVVVMTVLASVYAQSGKPDKQLPPIPLEDIHERGIEGRLKVPLGTIVDLRGQVVENRSKEKAYSADRYFFSIVEINGKRIGRTTVFPSSEMQMPKEADDFQVGDSFHCVGYETGGFQGSPESEFNYVPSYATRKFHFGTGIVVLKVE